MNTAWNDATDNLPQIAGADDSLLGAMLALPRDKYTNDTAVLVRFLRARGMGLSRESLEAFRESLLNDYHVDPRTGRTFKYKPRSINRLLAAAKKRVRQVMESPINAGRFDMVARFEAEKALEDIKGVKVAVALDQAKVMTDAEVRQLIEAAEATEPWLALVMRFLANTGCRISETLDIHPCDIKLVRNVHYVTVKGKGAKYRDVKITPELYVAITSHFKGKAFLFEHHAHAYERRYVTSRIGALGKRVLGRTGISAHCFRHTFATLYRSRKPEQLPELSRYLGHASTAITCQYYDHLAMSDVNATSVVSF